MTLPALSFASFTAFFVAEKTGKLILYSGQGLAYVHRMKIGWDLNTYIFFCISSLSLSPVNSKFSILYHRVSK